MLMKKNLLLTIALIGSSAPLTYAGSMGDVSSVFKRGHSIFQLGWNWSYQGQEQHINMVDLIGDEFTVSSHTRNNVLVGAGYFLDGPTYRSINMSYGINAFYLANTKVTGYVVQENLFTNLSYQYSVAHFPIYVDAKATIPTPRENTALTLDVGVGPNFMNTRGFQETPVDAITLPDTIFSGKSYTTFSATAGLGIKFNQLLGQLPIEIGYRFFYLGDGRFNVINSQVLNTLRTGPCYGNAIVVSATI